MDEGSREDSQPRQAVRFATTLDEFHISQFLAGHVIQEFRTVSRILRPIGRLRIINWYDSPI